MPATATDRLAGLTTSVAVKAPVKAVFTTPITLTGLQGGLSEGDRALVVAQSDPIDNGIYDASTSDWQRSADFDGARDVVNGTLVVVPLVNGNGSFYQVNGTDPIYPGTSPITFTLRDNPNITYAQTAAEIAAGVTPTNSAYPSLDPLRYGVVGDGVTNDVAAWTRWRSVVNQVSTTGPLHDYGIRPEPTSFGGQPTNLEQIVLGDAANTAYGYQSQPLTSGFGTSAVLGNTSFGYRSLKVNVTGQFNTSIGANNLTSSTGLGFNTSIGYGCSFNTTIGTSNVAMGFEAFHDNQAGSANCVIGYSAQHTGLANGGANDVNNVTVVGTFAAQFNFGSNITAVGYSALKNNRGAGNLGVGFQAGLNLTTGADNILIGDTAGGNMTTGSHSVIIGFQAGLTLSTTTGFNTYVGSLAGFWNTTAAQNVAVGYQALGGTNGSNGAGGNTAVGYGAMQLCGNPSACTAVGQLALKVVSTGGNNTAVGNNALVQETTGTQNTAIGDSAGATQTAGFSNTTNVGYQATSTASNQITLGNASVATLRCQQTTITALSDVRFKKNVQLLDLPDGFLAEVQIVSYEWIIDGMPAGPQVGVIAQQLDVLQEKYGLQWLGLVDKSNPDRWEATPGKLLFPLIQRVQQQDAQLKRFESRLERLERALRY